MELMIWKIKEDAKVKRWPLTSLFSCHTMHWAHREREGKGKLWWICCCSREKERKKNRERRRKKERCHCCLLVCADSAVNLTRVPCTSWGESCPDQQRRLLEGGSVGVSLSPYMDVSEKFYDCVFWNILSNYLLWKRLKCSPEILSGEFMIASRLTIGLNLVKIHGWMPKPFGDADTPTFHLWSWRNTLWELRFFFFNNRI